MRATVVDRSLPDRLTVIEVAEPLQGPSDTIVRMVATSLNAGECKRALFNAEDGFRPGWDVAGVVEKAAPDGSGPTAGERVVGFIESGAWAQKVSIPARRLAVIPSQLSFEQAATLPVAGLTAYYALAQAGLLIGKSVLVNGASGSVGRIACQLAKASGATVVAIVRRQEAVTQVKAYNVDHILVTEDPRDASDLGPFDLAVESVGGAALGAAMEILAGDGVCVTLGDAGSTPATFSPRPFFRAGSARLYGLYVYEEIHRHPPADALRRMLHAISRGLLQPPVASVAAWTDIGPEARRVVDRQVNGKAVIRIQSAD